MRLGRDPIAHVVASAEPAVVFTSLAKQSVPTFSDGCTIDIVETHDDAYYISYSLTHPPRSESAHAVRASSGRRSVERTVAKSATDHANELCTPVYSAGNGTGSAFAGEVIHTWTDHKPTLADVSIAQLAVDLAVAAIARERLADSVPRAKDSVAQLRRRSLANRQIGIAVGILMATHKITYSVAFDLLSSASQRSNRTLIDVADDVVHSGWLA